MKIIFYLFFFIIVINCSTKKGVYWCGDHPCINKEEKETYFKKTMIVEIKEIKKDISNENSNIEKIIQQAKTDEKKRIKEEKALAKQLRLEEKQRIKEEKKLTKQSRLDEKKIGNEAKAEGDCTKLVKLHEKLKCKMDEKKANKAKSKKDDSKIKLEASVINEKDMDSSVEFNELVKKIHKKNLSRSYPDINDIPK